MVLYIWRLSTERIVNGTITEKLTPGYNETGLVSHNIREKIMKTDRSLSPRTMKSKT